MAVKKKNKVKKKPSKTEFYERGGKWHDEHGYYRTADEPELKKHWWDIKPVSDHRREFLLRIVARYLDNGTHGAATNIMLDDFVKVMAENARLRKDNKKLRIKLRKK